MVHVPYATSGNLYAYGGNNPIIFIDPNGEFNTKQFAFAAIQTIGGIVEVSSTCAASVGTGGLATGIAIYATIDGIANIGDGIIGMMAAVKDIEYRGFVAETSTLVAKEFGISDDKVKLIGDIVGTVKAFVDMDVFDIPNLAQGFNSGSRVIDTVDTIIDCASRTATYESSIEIGANIIKKFNSQTTENVWKSITSIIKERH